MYLKILFIVEIQLRTHFKLELKVLFFCVVFYKNKLQNARSTEMQTGSRLCNIHGITMPADPT